MKILFVMASPEYLRFYDSTIHLLADRGHDVSLLVNSEREKKPVGLEGLTSIGGSVRVLGVAPVHEGLWGNIAYGLRGLTDFVRYLHPRFAEAPVLRARMKRKATPVAFRVLDRIRSLPPTIVRRIVAGLAACERAIPPARPIVEFIRSHAPDIVLVSPLVDAASDQVDWIKGAQAAGVRSAACVASWDNLTNKGLLRIEPDRVIVWNEAQKREAVDYHYVAPERVVTTGAQLFDRWFDCRVTRAREVLCAHVGLPDARPYLLFTGSSSFISESNAEVAFVRRWIAAIRGSSDSWIRDVGILVRPHPYNCHAWEHADLSEFEGVAIYPRRGYNPVDDANRADFFDSLYHSSAIIGINTSAMIEAAIVGRPVFSIAADEFAGTQEGTLHFHYLLPENGGCVRIAGSIDEHVQQLAAPLRDPQAAHAETQRFVASFIRPHGLERPATPIVADAIEDVGRLGAAAPQRMPAWAYVLQPIVLAVAGVAAVIGWAQGPAPLGSARKRLRHVAHRLGKYSHRSRTMITDRPQTFARRAWKRTVRSTRQRAEQARGASRTMTRRVRHLVGAGSHRLVGAGSQILVRAGSQILVRAGSQILARAGSQILVGAGSQILVGAGFSRPMGRLKRTPADQPGPILLVVASPEYVRFFDATIVALAERGHRVHLVVNDAASHKPVGLEGVSALPLAGMTVMPAARTFWADTAYALRAVVDFIRFLHPDFANAPALRERIKRKVLPAAFQWLDGIGSLPVSALNALLAALAWCEWAIPIDPRVVARVRELDPSLVIVSPLVDAASAQVDWIKAAARHGVPSALAVASWDNLTNKGLMRVRPDRVFVWNAIQCAEAIRYHRMPADRTVVTGAPVFDRWFGAVPSRTREAFCADAGLPDGQPFVLFTGSSAFIADDQAEVAFVRRWIAALRASPSLEVRNLAVLVRPHPYNAGAWTSADLSDRGPVSVWPRGTFNHSDEQGRRDFFDSLYYSSAVVGINTSAMIEAAIVGRPVLTITDFTSTQVGTLHFHYLLPEHGGPVLAASSLTQHVEQLAAVLQDSESGRIGARRFVESFVRPHGTAHDAMPRLVAAVEDTARLRVAPRTIGLALALRPVMAEFGMWTAIVERLTGPDPWAPVRKSVLHPIRDLRKRVARDLALRRERAARTGRLARGRAERVRHTLRAQFRALPSIWKKCRRGLRHARYAVGVFVKGDAPAPPRKS